MQYITRKYSCCSLALQTNATPQPRSKHQTNTKECKIKRDKAKKVKPKMSRYMINIFEDAN